MPSSEQEKLPPERFIALHGAFNVRDLGGYETLDGRRIRWRRVLRADGPERLTDRDRAVVAGLDIATVIDLRVPGESGGARWEVSRGGSQHNIALFDVLVDYSKVPPLRTFEDMGGRYLFRLEGGASAIVKALTLMADNLGRPVLFHCAAGKDRTGILAAVLLQLLGVPDQTIVEDYALSHDAHFRKIARVKSDPRLGDHDYERMPELAKGAHPEVMQELLRVGAERYGSLVGCVEAAGLTTDVVDRLRSQLLVA